MAPLLCALVSPSDTEPLQPAHPSYSEPASPTVTWGRPGPCGRPHLLMLPTAGSCSRQGLGQLGVQAMGGHARGRGRTALLCSTGCAWPEDNWGSRG